MERIEPRRRFPSRGVETSSASFSVVAYPPKFVPVVVISPRSQRAKRVFDIMISGAGLMCATPPRG